MRRPMTAIALLLVLLAVPAAAAKREPVSFAVQFETEDGFTIHGDLASSGGAAGPVAILLHMVRSDRSAWKPMVPELTAAGFTVLAIDQRAHGESTARGGESVRVTAIPRDEFAGVVRDGVKDVAAARAFLAQRGIATDRIALVGASYGCSVALLSSTDVEGVRALVLLSPGTAYFGVDVVEQARRFKGPILAVGADDDVRAARAAHTLVGKHEPPSRALVYPSGGHGTNLFATRPEVTAAVVEFLTRALAP